MELAERGELVKGIGGKRKGQISVVGGLDPKDSQEIEEEVDEV